MSARPPQPRNWHGRFIPRLDGFAHRRQRWPGSPVRIVRPILGRDRAGHGTRWNPGREATSLPRRSPQTAQEVEMAVLKLVRVRAGMALMGAVLAVLTVAAPAGASGSYAFDAR